MDTETTRNKKRKHKKKLTHEQRVNAEMKHLRLRIKRLEDLVLTPNVDNGDLNGTIDKLKQG